MLERRFSVWSTDARWLQSVNQADEFTVTRPLEDPDTQSGAIVKPDVIWLLNGPHELLQEFSVADMAPNTAGAYQLVTEEFTVSEAIED